MTVGLAYGAAGRAARQRRNGTLLLLQQRFLRAGAPGADALHDSGKKLATLAHAALGEFKEAQVNLVLLIQGKRGHGSVMVCSPCTRRS